MKKLIILPLAISLAIIFTNTITSSDNMSEPIANEVVSEITYEPIAMDYSEVIATIIYEPKISQEDKELIALVTMGEAEGESEEGKRLVIDSILNRVDSQDFPNTYREVIYQKNQYSCVWNGRIDRLSPTEEVYTLIDEELADRYNDEVIYFTANSFSKYGNPMFRVGNHYFSSN